MVTDVLTALCLVLIIEGILPFLSPDGYKQAMKAMLDLENGQLRTIALSSMVVGVILLAIVR